MPYALLIKMGMFVTTMGVVFWLGWTLPTPFDRGHERAAELSEASKDEMSSVSGGPTAASSSHAVSPADQPSDDLAPKRSRHYLLDLNRATNQDLDSLPGIGPKLAERIIEYRQSVGVIHALDELRAVRGIGKKTVERIRPLVSVTVGNGLANRGKKMT